MDVSKITSEHIKLVKKYFGIEKEKFLNMSDEELHQDDFFDELCVISSFLANDSDPDSDFTPDAKCAEELIDIINGDI